MGVTVRALNADVYERDPGFREFLQLSDGRFLLDEEGIVVSTEVARRLEVGVDDELRLLTLRTVGGRTLPPRVTRLTVRGVVSSGYQELDRLWVFINLETGRRVLPVSDARQIVGIKIDEPFGLDNPLFQNADPIRAVFEASASTDPGEIRADIRRSIGSDWFVLSWYEADRSQYISFTTTKNLLVFIMVLIVGVAALNISSSVVMLVLERRQDIAILRSTGTDAGQIVSTFTLSGFLVGALGTAVGLGLGLVVAANINEVLQGIEIVGDIVARLLRLAVSPFVETPATDFVLFDPEFYLEQIPVRINLTQLVIVATLSLLLSTLASFVPAWKAGQIKPLELLRKH
jgi:lipoprotein-releasing system permease protein